jgi:hypothetical protein
MHVSFWRLKKRCCLYVCLMGYKGRKIPKFVWRLFPRSSFHRAFVYGRVGGFGKVLDRDLDRRDVSPDCLVNAYNEGALAGGAGLDRCRNHYTKGCPEYYAWNDGWVSKSPNLPYQDESNG